MTAFANAIAMLLNQIKDLEERLEKNRKALRSMQAVCDHDWELTYENRHNGDHEYTCKRCMLGPTKHPDAYR